MHILVLESSVSIEVNERIPQFIVIEIFKTQDWYLLLTIWIHNIRWIILPDWIGQKLDPLFATSGLNLISNIFNIFRSSTKRMHSSLIFYYLIPYMFLFQECVIKRLLWIFYMNSYPYSVQILQPNTSILLLQLDYRFKWKEYTK